MSLTGPIFANRTGKVGERLPQKIIIVTFHSFFFVLHTRCILLVKHMLHNYLSSVIQLAKFSIWRVTEH